ncbi:MAG: RNA-binding protein [Actinobacteria bacterium]|nr:RNA-binding protein [Actinomycetota bacterium]
MTEAALIEMVEGKPAPMPLLAVQAFANTVDIEDESDRLESAESFERWLLDAGLVEPDHEIRPHHLRIARELRDTLRDNLASNSAGEPDPEAARKRAGTVQIELRPDEEGHLALDLSPAPSLAVLGSQLMAIAFQSQIEGTWERLKLCENPDCRWAFYDNSRNRSGSWCRMGLCGNRLKNRAYRERHRGEIAGSVTAAAVRPGRPPKGS